MKTHFFSFGGWQRSYWDFNFGYGLMTITTVFIETLVFWQLATLARRGATSVLRSS